MKKIFSLLLLFMLGINTFAQYSKVTCEKIPENLSIVQVDYRESSTLVCFKLICESADQTPTIYEKTYAKVDDGIKQYHLLNSINMPIFTDAEQKCMMFERAGQEHYFVLEFECMPKGKTFTIIENTDESTNPFNCYNIKVDTTVVNDYINLNDLVTSYPVKEIGMFLKDNMPIQYIKYNGIIITTYAYGVKEYGKYYQINLNVQNLSGKSILFSLDKVTAEGYRFKNEQLYKTIPMEILSSYEYDKTVKRKQAWNNFWVALGEGMAAANAGYSYSSTAYSGSSYSSAYGHASGYVGNTYGYTNAYGSAYTTTYGRANTTTYNGAAAYAAQQQANANYEAFANGQREIRQQLNEGYVKNNTIRNEVEYSGFFNIKYKKLDRLKVVFTIDGVQYPFIY